jgi:hypothetical protein
MYTLLHSKVYVLLGEAPPFALQGCAGYPQGKAGLVENEEAGVGRKRRNDSRGRAEGRVRGRVQQRARGGAKRGGDSGRKRNDLDLGAIEDYASRLAGRSGGRSGGTSGLTGAASGLAGAASGFAGGSFASRLMSGDTSMSDEDFRKEVAEHFALLEERLRLLEEQVSGSGEQDAVVEEDLPEPEGGTGHA